MFRTEPGRGKAWEADVEDQHIAYELAGLCTFIRNEPVRTKRWEDAAMMEADMRRGRGAPDYTVLGADGGWWLKLEVKEYHGACWPWSQLKPWQASRLDRALRVRGCAAVLLRLHPGGIFLLPWASIGPAWHARAAGSGPRGFTPASGLGVPLATADYFPAMGKSSSHTAAASLVGARRMDW